MRGTSTPSESWVVVGTNSLVLTSIYDIHWKRATNIPTNTAALYSVSQMNGNTIAVGENGNVIYSEDNGHNWKSAYFDNDKADNTLYAVYSW